MNFFEAINELDHIQEDYNGGYKSPYLNISDSERQAAYNEYMKQISNTHYLQGGKIWKSTPQDFGWLHIIDYECFHKAFDKDLDNLGLLNVFKADGTLGPSGVWGSICKIQKGDPNYTLPAYQKLVELWVVTHAKERGMIRGHWYSGEDFQREKSHYVTKEQALIQAAEWKKIEDERHRQAMLAWEKKQAEEKAAEAERAKKRAAEVAEIVKTETEFLTAELEKAYQNIDPQLKEAYLAYTDFMGLPDIPEINVEYQPQWRCSQITLTIPNILEKKFYGPAETHSAAEFKNIIEKALNEAALSSKVLLAEAGIAEIEKAYKACGRCGIYCVFVDLETDELYTCKETFKLKDKTGNDVPAERCAQAAVVFVKFSWADSRNSNRTTSDNYYYARCSWASDMETRPEISKLIPHTHTTYLGGGTWVTPYLDPNDSSHPEDFVEYEGIDSWADVKIIDPATD